uniref:Uncharacterized protein n=1 Tax=Peronospora matthiolae TaxID=2874970 RepID=A0AAV1USE5_9STRA
MTEDMENLPEEPKLHSLESFAVRHCSDNFEHKAEVSPNTDMSGLPIHFRQILILQSRKVTIDQIFGSRRLERFSALLNFLTATVSELKIVEKERLASVDMTEITNIEVV